MALLSCVAISMGLLLLRADAQMPYNPTRILQNDTLLYVFRPTTSPQFELVSIDLTSTLSADLPFTTLYAALPFLNSTNVQAFTPAIDSGGNVTVYTGDCSQEARGAQVWIFAPEHSDRNGNGTWSQGHVSDQDTNDSGLAVGPKFLSAGFAFSSQVGAATAATDLFYFGGMCPYPGAWSGSWQSSANYSNSMVSLAPQESAKGINYGLTISPSRGPPVAEAGFSVTGLEQTFSNKSDGSQTQQQDFVFIGGHTNSAFINMSQVALFSLPQQSWTFLPAHQPDAQRTDLSIRSDTAEVESRSGHTAVLTPDAQRIIILGGWVGDPTTPAEPQLAVLNVGDGYGGQGDWQWSVPAASGGGLANSVGIYGHGAIMLPGGVMMVSGGYSIPSSANARQRREPATNAQTYFLNTTSNSWLSQYSPPQQPSSSAQNTGPLSRTSQKAGLGVGLAVGSVAIVGLLSFYIWFTRRMRKQREVREKQLRDLALAAHRYEAGGLSFGIDGRGGNADAVDYLDDPSDPYATFVEIPSPTRGLRRSLSGRANPNLARYEERRVKGPGPIHPIDELEEEEDQSTDKTPLAAKPDMAEQPNRQHIFNTTRGDPFTDEHRLSGLHQHPIVHSAPSSPTRDGAEDPAHWPSRSASGARRHSPTSSGRISPKSDRTGSNLSEHSATSNVSAKSGFSMHRKLSVRSGPVLERSQANPFKTPDVSPVDDTSIICGDEPRTSSITSNRSNRSTRPITATAFADADSFTTARTSFMHLQAEGHALLGGCPDRDRPGTSSTGSHGVGSPDAEILTAEAVSVTVCAEVTPPRRKSWLGSVRRALARTPTLTESRGRARRNTASTPRPEP